jgi:hypothetical protein
MRSPAFATTWSVARLVMGLVIVAAVVTQLAKSVTTTVELGRDLATTIANFFSFFTILSNLIAATVLLWAAIALWRRGSGAVTDSAPLATALACASTYMIITGIVYNALLRQIVLEQGSLPVPWSNEVLHLIGPLFLLVDVLIGPARRALRWRAVGIVLVFPLAWSAYTLIRGSLVTSPVTGDPWWYPYPFLNPHGPGGWPSVIAYVIGISLAFVAVGAFVVWMGRRRNTRRHMP